jgi:hypothetical protein
MTLRYTKRPLVVQTFHTFPLILLVHTPTPLIPVNQQLWGKDRLVTSFIISNPAVPPNAAPATSIYLGNSPVTGTPTTGNPGLEIPPGSAPSFPIFQETRPEYANANDDFPFVVWDMTQLFLNTDSQVQVTIAVFPTMFL